MGLSGMGLSGIRPFWYGPFWFWTFLTLIPNLSTIEPESFRASVRNII